MPIESTPTCEVLCHWRALAIAQLTAREAIAELVG